jgi:hypothetical protein
VSASFLPGDQAFINLLGGPLEHRAVLCGAAFHSRRRRGDNADVDIRIGEATATGPKCCDPVVVSPFCAQDEGSICTHLDAFQVRQSSANGVIGLFMSCHSPGRIPGSRSVVRQQHEVGAKIFRTPDQQFHNCGSVPVTLRS